MDKRPSVGKPDFEKLYNELIENRKKHHDNIEQNLLRSLVSRKQHIMLYKEKERLSKENEVLNKVLSKHNKAVDTLIKELDRRCYRQSIMYIMENNYQELLKFNDEMQFETFDYKILPVDEEGNPKQRFLCSVCNSKVTDQLYFCENKHIHHPLCNPEECRLCEFIKNQSNNGIDE